MAMSAVAEGEVLDLDRRESHGLIAAARCIKLKLLDDNGKPTFPEYVNVLIYSTGDDDLPKYELLRQNLSEGLVKMFHGTRGGMKLLDQWTATRLACERDAYENIRYYGNPNAQNLLKPLRIRIGDDILEKKVEYLTKCVAEEYEMIKALRAFDEIFRKYYTTGVKNTMRKRQKVSVSDEENSA